MDEASGLETAAAEAADELLKSETGSDESVVSASIAVSVAEGEVVEIVNEDICD